VEKRESEERGRKARSPRGVKRGERRSQGQLLSLLVVEKVSQDVGEGCENVRKEE